MTPEERLLVHVQDWVPRFLAGQLKDRALLRPTLREGERFGAKVGSIAVSRVPARDPLIGVDRSSTPIGIVYGTSERLIVANGGRVKRSWEWSQVAEVLVLTGYVGVAVDTGGEDAEAVHHVKLQYDPFAPPPYVLGARWIAMEACFRASRGELDAWLERLPGRVLA